MTQAVQQAPENEAIYLFCLTQSSSSIELEGEGIDNQSSLELLELGALSAVICRVKLQQFVGTEAETNLQDLNWVGPRALRHQQVIQDVMSARQVMPVRFATLFHSRQELLDRITPHEDVFVNFLAQSANHSEWSVKVVFDRASLLQQISDELIATHQHELDKLAQGRRYFELQKLRQQAETRLKQQINEVCHDAETTLHGLSRQSNSLRLLGREQNGLELDMAANWAFLVENSQLDLFRSAIQALNEKPHPVSLQFRVSGPWPPYSFCPALPAG